MPRPCRARDRPWASPRPRTSRSQTSVSRQVSSTLLATSRTRPGWRRTTSAARASSSVTPVVASTTKSTASASAMARSDCSAHLVVEGVAAGQPPAGVDQDEPAPVPLGLDLLAVAGDARALLDDRLAPADDAVHERRLADVGAADDGDGGQGHGRPGYGPPPARRTADGRRSAQAGVTASRRATPWVATTSTGRGRSSGAVPSRKRPWDRQTSGSR